MLVYISVNIFSKNLLGNSRNVKGKLLVIYVNKNNNILRQNADEKNNKLFTIMSH